MDKFADIQGVDDAESTGKNCRPLSVCNTHIVIHPDNRPLIFELLTELYYAMGAVSRHEPARTVFAIPVRFEPFLDDMEDRIEHLTNEEIQIFCDGDEAEMRAIAGRSFGLTKAHELLEAMFDGEGSL